MNSLRNMSISRRLWLILIVAVIGVLGYAMAVLKFDAAPLLLGFVLGPLMEENLRRALLLSRGDLGTFLDRPISAGILAFGGALVAWTLWSALMRQLKGKPAARDFSD